MRFTITYGDHQGTGDYGTKAECLRWAQGKSARHAAQGGYIPTVHVVEALSPRPRFGRKVATFIGGERIA